MAIVNYLLQSGNGFLFDALMSDVLVFIALFYVTIKAVFPFIKSLREMRKTAKRFGGPKGHWFWGDITKYGFSHEGMENCVQRCKDFPAMCTFYLAFKPTYHFYHPDVNKTVLTRTATKSWVYQKILSTLLRNGLVTANGGIWKRHRRLLTVIFHFDILKEHCQVFNKNFEVVTKAFDEIAETGSVQDVAPTLSLLAYSNMMECVMSQSAVDEDGNTNVFIPVVSKLNDLLLSRQQNPLHWIESIYKRTKKGKLFAEARDTIHEESIRIIKERQTLLSTMSESDTESGSNVITDQNGKTFVLKRRKGKIMDFLDILIQTKDENGVGLTNDEIVDEVITFFLAGMETAGTTMKWVAYLLANNQECQDKCREEVSTVLGDKEDIEMSDLNKLPYLNQCVKETLRLYPPLHVVARALDEDTSFSHRFNNHKNVALKKGTNAIVNIYVTHRNPEVWNNPEVFDPERFNEENVTKIIPFSYIPFAAGPRNCIGQHLGMTEAKVSMAQLLRRYQLHWDPKVPHPKLNVGVTLQPSDGVPLIIKRLQK